MLRQLQAGNMTLFLYQSYFMEFHGTAMNLSKLWDAAIWKLKKKQWYMMYSNEGKDTLQFKDPIEKGDLRMPF